MFLAALAVSPHVAHVDHTTHAEDEALGVDALVTVRGEAAPAPIDATTRGRGCRGYVANLLDTLRRGVVPVVMEVASSDLAPEDAFAAFTFWRRASEQYVRAGGGLVASGEPTYVSRG